MHSHIVHTCTHTLIPAHGLNLINQMKLCVNRPNIKKGKKGEERKKKEGTIGRL